jgi:hypothetical protein
MDDLPIGAALARIYVLEINAAKGIAFIFNEPRGLSGDRYILEFYFKSSIEKGEMNIAISQKDLTKWKQEYLHSTILKSTPKD